MSEWPRGSARSLVERSLLLLARQSQALEASSSSGSWKSNKPELERDSVASCNAREVASIACVNCICATARSCFDCAGWLQKAGWCRSKLKLRMLCVM